MIIEELLQRWAEDRTAAREEELLDAIQHDPTYASHRNLLRDVGPLLEAGSYERARATIMQVFPGQLLSPSTHSLLSRTLRGLGDDAGADLQGRFVQASLQRILNSGAGDEQHPYVVLRISDEYDALRALGFAQVTQYSVGDEERLVDVFTDAEGREVHFALRNRGRRIRAS